MIALAWPFVGLVAVCLAAFIAREELKARRLRVEHQAWLDLAARVKDAEDKLAKVSTAQALGARR